MKIFLVILLFAIATNCSQPWVCFELLAEEFEIIKMPLTIDSLFLNRMTMSKNELTPIGYAILMAVNSSKLRESYGGKQKFVAYPVGKVRGDNVLCLLSF